MFLIISTFADYRPNGARIISKHASLTILGYHLALYDFIV